MVSSPIVYSPWVRARLLLARLPVSAPVHWHPREALARVGLIATHGWPCLDLIRRRAIALARAGVDIANIEPTASRDVLDLITRIGLGKDHNANGPPQRRAVVNRGHNVVLLPRPHGKESFL